MASKGRNILIKISDGTSPGNFTTVAGLRSKAVVLENETVDITNSESQSYRELLGAGSGSRSLALSGSGIFTDDSSHDIIEEMVLNSSSKELQIIFENGDTVQGLFTVASLTYNGDYGGAQMYDVSFLSASIFTLLRYVAPVVGDTPLASCATSWVEITHPADTSGLQRARFNGSEASPFYLLLGGTGSAGAVSWSATGNGDFVSGSTNCTQYCIDAAYDSFNGKWIVVGWPNIIENSSDGKTFTSRSHPEPQNKNGVACDLAGNCVVVADHTGPVRFELSSNGGDTWSSSNTVIGISSVFRAVATNNKGVWLASRGTGTYRSTNNGLDWVAVGVAGGGSIDRELIWCEELGLWVFVIGSYIHTSTDNGDTWIERYNAVSWNFLRVAYSTADCLVAVGFTGNAVQSNNGITWSPISIGGSENFGGVLVDYNGWMATTGTKLYRGT